MLSKKDWIKNLDDDTLKMLFSKQDILNEMPDKLKMKLNYMAENYNKRHKGETFKSNPFKLILRYSAAISFTVIVIFSIIYLISTIYLSKFKNHSQVNYINGTAYKLIFNKSFKLKIGNKLKENDKIKTDKNSLIKFNIGNNAKIEMSEKSLLTLLQLYKKENTEVTNLFLKNGYAEFYLSKISNDSTFIVQTDKLIASAIGTHFSIKENPEHETLIKIFEGKVRIKINLNLPFNRIKNINKNLYDKINDIINQENIVLSNQKVHVSLNQKRQLEKKICDLIINTENEMKKYKKNKDKTNELIRKANLKIDEWYNEYKKILKPVYINQEQNTNNILFDKNNQNNDIKNILIKKLPYNPGINLEEKDTSIIADNQNIYIASDSHKTLFCINFNNGKLLWKFTNSLLTKITSPPIIYQNKIILCTAKNIFIINKNAQIDTILDIKDGPIYWAHPTIYKNSLLIPANDMIYQLNGSILNQYENIFNNPGQLYINNANDNTLYLYNINSRTIRHFSLENNTSLAVTLPLKQRAFMSPVINDKYIFIADSVDSLYRYDIKLQKSQTKIIKLQTGVISEIIIKNNYLYFIGNNGAFYHVNIQSFDKVNKIFQVDRNPDPNKYLVKKPVLFENSIYYPSDTGKIFIYDLENNHAKMIDVAENTKNQSLIIYPIKIKDALYFIDKNSNIYKLTIEESF